jgi:hypothetical protein
MGATVLAGEWVGTVVGDGSNPDGEVVIHMRDHSFYHGACGTPVWQNGELLGLVHGWVHTKDDCSPFSRVARP